MQKCKPACGLCKSGYKLRVAGHNFRSRVSAIGDRVQVLGFSCRYRVIYFPTANRLRMTWVGAPPRGVRGRIDVIGSHDLPGSSIISLRTGATPSRPYPLMYRVGMSVLAQPRLTKGGQPYPLHSLPTCPPVNRSTNVASLWPTGQPVNRSTNVVSFCSSGPLHPHPSPDARNTSIKQIYD